MKRLLLIVMGVLLCTPLYSDMNPYIYGVTVASAPAGCSSGTIDSYAYFESTGNAGVEITANAKGNSFQVSEAGSVHSVSIYVDAVTGGGGDVTLRWGTAQNLGTGTYYESGPVTITATGWHEFVFSTKGDVSTSTTYYWGAVFSGAGKVTMYQRNTDGDAYTYGAYTYAGKDGWDMNNILARDTYFRVKLCD